MILVSHSRRGKPLAAQLVGARVDCAVARSFPACGGISPRSAGVICVPQAAVFLAALLVIATGCQSGGLSSYVSPRVTGRVINAETQQPLPHVKVSRVTPKMDDDDPEKGGQVMEDAWSTWTDRQGVFVLDSEKDIALLRKPGWYSVTVLYHHEEFTDWQTNYTVESVTSYTTEGEPVVDAGLIRLEPEKQ